jgi:hypothetical protein
MNQDDKAILGKLTELVQRHDTKLTVDFVAIKRLEKDTDQLAVSTGSLVSSVAELSGAVKTQSGVVNGILAVTVIAFLGFVVKSVMPSKPQQTDAKVLAEALVQAIATSPDLSSVVAQSRMRRVSAKAKKESPHGDKTAVLIVP